jgi:hypothetical protein
MIWRWRTVLVAVVGLVFLGCYGASVWNQDRAWRIAADTALLLLGSCLALLADGLGPRVAPGEGASPRHLQSTLRADSPDAVFRVLGSVANWRASREMIRLVTDRHDLAEVAGVLVAVATFLVAAAMSGQIGVRRRG